VRTLQYFAANALTGAGLQTLRLRLMLAALLINLAVCLILIPRYSWRGAVWATAIAEVTYAAILWVTALSIAGREAANPNLQRCREHDGCQRAGELPITCWPE
jgi:O-antigen/teichoic acid export membrane protein